MRHETLPFYGLQFHPEVTHTPLGSKVLGNFLSKICGCHGTWQLGDFADQAVEEIRRRVGSDRVICGLSGGVDSSVVAALIYRAIGSQLSCILIDNGLLRKAEEASVIGEFSSHFKTDLHVVKAEDKFLAALAGVTDPQEKRRRIGHAFIDCFSDEAAKISGAKFLAQGTLYPDVIESGAARRRTGRHDQAAPQRRRIARGLELRADRAVARPVQGRSPQPRPAARSARGNRLAPSVPRPWPGRALPGRSHQGAARHASRGRRDRGRGDQGGRALPLHLAGLRRAAAGAERGRDGRCPHLSRHRRRAGRRRPKTS